MKPLTALIAAAMLFLMGATAASASSGAFTTAFATPDWTFARFSGSGEATPCPQTGACSYMTAVAAVPSLPEYASCQEVILGSDPNTVTAWTGSQYSTNTSFAFDAPKAAIIHGVYGQRLCLMVFGNREIVDVVCEIERKTFEEFDGKPRPLCPLRKVVFEERLASALLTVEPPPPPALPAPQATPPPIKTTTPRRRCSKNKRKVHRAGKVRCVAKRHRHRRSRYASPDQSNAPAQH